MDLISNMLTIIKNGQASKRESVVTPYSRVGFGILEILKKKNKIKDVEVKKRGNKEWSVVYLKYEESGSPCIENIKKISKPGKRVYRKKAELYPVRHGYGFYVLSTPLGVMEGADAKNKGVGGEVLCEVW